MRSSHRQAVRAAILIGPLVGAMAAAVPYADPPAPGAPSTSAAPPADSSAPLPDRAELLRFAFDTASAIPSDPHEKDRARAQERVADAWLALGEPARARRCLDELSTWRRGAGYARVAEALAAQGDPEGARQLLEAALRVAESQEEGWRRDRILVSVAGVLARLGQDDAALRLEEGVVPSEAGKVDAVRAAIEPQEQFDERLASLDQRIAIGSVEGTKAATAALAELFRRYFDDAEKRASAEQRIRSAWSILPLTERIALLFMMADAATAHGEPDRARTLLDEAAAYLVDERWLPELKVPLFARLAEHRAGAGDAEGARRDAQAAWAFYESRRDGVADVFRAEALRPLAEANARLGQADEARRLYGVAIEEGALNPNARPRAIDLSATIASMASVELIPDAALWQRMRDIRAGLGDPW